MKEGYTEIHSDGTFKVGELQISKCDKDSSNGFLHIVDHEWNSSEAHSGQETAWQTYSVFTDIKSDVIVDKNGIEIEGHYIDNG